VCRGGFVRDGGSFVAGKEFRRRDAAERFLRSFDLPDHVRMVECWSDELGRDYGSVREFAPGDVVDLSFGWDL
jgi:hypothetical protein